MNKLESRVSRLESSLNSQDSFVILSINKGELLEDCIRRHGYDPNSTKERFMALTERELRL